MESCNVAGEKPHDKGNLADCGKQKGQSVSHPESDPDLAHLNAVWPTLSPEKRAQILDMIGGDA